MIRSVRDNKNNNNNIDRSRSKSPNNSKVNLKSNDKNKGKNNIKSNNKLNRSRSKSPERSPKGKNKNQKNNLKKSKSQKKLNKSLSQSKILPQKGIKNVSKLQKSASKNGSSPKVSQAIDNKSMLIKSARKNGKQQNPKNNNKQKVNNKSPKQSKQLASNSIKIQQKQMGLIFLMPQHDKVIFKNLQVTDEVFQKYHDMISNDNDTGYVTNSLPQLINLKKQDDSAGRDFVSGKIARLSGVFDNLTLDKIVTASKKVPQYYTGQCGKNLHSTKIILHTKFKVQVDIGFLLYSVDGDKLTIFRIYVSKIYRKMNYLGFIYLEIFKMLMSKHSGCDRWSIFILQRNILVHKFFKYLGFKIEKIATQSKNKTVDYFQEFSMKKKQLNTVIASMK